MRQDFDGSGNISESISFAGFKSCFRHEAGRGLESTRVEGLSEATQCDAVMSNGASIPDGARKISTRWHPKWSKVVVLAEPQRLTTFVYNGQQDPFDAGRIASCTPTDALLPSGDPIVVLCKRVVQLTTDLDGAKGFAAPVDTSTGWRTQKWTYNKHGQVLSYKDANDNTTIFEYFTGTSISHTDGDLYRVVNSKQHATSFAKYDPAGNWLEMLDPNGVVTTRTFDARQRLKSFATAESTTSYEYWPTGFLRRITWPDLSSLNYGYDDAHRLTSVSDGIGNSVTYTLDPNGIRLKEDVRDKNGLLTKTLSRIPDALNRIQQVTGRP